MVIAILAATCAGADLSALQGKLGKAQNRADSRIRWSLLPAIADAARNRQASVGNVHRHASTDVHRHRAHAIMLNTIRARLSTIATAR